MIKVFVVCSGLGNVNRGFESFTQEFFDVFSASSYLEIRLFKGGSKTYDFSRELWNLPRNSLFTKKISDTARKINPKMSPGFLEEFSFFVSLVPYLYTMKPQVIYFSQSRLGTLLWRWRTMTQQKYKLLFRNGGPAGAFDNLKSRWDHIQQLSPFHLQVALDEGVPSQKQTLVPNAVHIAAHLSNLSPSERKTLRSRLGLPTNRKILLSVTSIDRSHKRLDYLIHQLVTVEEKPYLLMLGQPGKESEEIIALAHRLLGDENFQTRTVKSQEMKDYYKVVDAFVLTSLLEGLSRSSIEAMSHGLPCLLHNSDNSRFVVGDQGYLGNFKLSGSLANLIPQALAESSNISQQTLRHQRVYEKFSWEKVYPDYVDLIQRCCLT